DVHKRLLVLDISEDQQQPMCFINPEIVAREGLEVSDEGCLSVPGVYEGVERSAQITVKALDRNGEEFETEADDLLAVCIQHEIDHLDGKLFVDYLSELKRQRLKKKFMKAQKQALATH
ncbi:MAG: peptide deformylase, partial [Gammaproteobacteria bacterium]|nr:peptide deformylase [Gammaproteobacteria bacterium]